MLMALDIGNSNICGGVFADGNLQVQFRKNSTLSSTSDELGLFLKSVLRENQIDPSQIKAISICSVVPNLVHSFRNCCIKYFHITPFFLSPQVHTGLKILYTNPLELGPDRIANAIAATNLYPQENLIVIDFGTATKFCVLTDRKEYLGGAIAPGLKIAMESLQSNTARLPSVEIITPKSAIGKSTVENIQSALYFGNIGMVKELVKNMTQESFPLAKPPRIIATGGFASLFHGTGLFDFEIPDLTLKGLLFAYKMNLKI